MTVNDVIKSRHFKVSSSSRCGEARACRDRLDLLGERGACVLRIKVLAHTGCRSLIGGAGGGMRGKRSH
jgi:hypothetical protein